jgi:uncharacterized protein (TIGR00730 family)
MLKKRDEKMKSICVFCGSSPGSKPEYTQAARRLGTILAQRKLALVYGGGNVGLMKQVAQAALAAGGEVIGVIPRKLVEMEVAYKELAQLHIVETMHERKALMAELADGFIAAPGGIGTLEEIFEALTWSQLGYHHKPCGLLNVSQYYDKLLTFLEGAVEQQFLDRTNLEMLLVDDNPEHLLDRLQTYQSPQRDKVAWVRAMTESTSDI